MKRAMELPERHGNSRDRERMPGSTRDTVGDAAGSSRQQKANERVGHVTNNTGRHRMRPRPNFFLAVKVAESVLVRNAVQLVQKAITESHPHLEGAMVDPETAHLTLLVMALDGEDDLQQAGECLQSSIPVLSEMQLLRPLRLRFQGLGHFNNKVLFLEVADGDGKEQLLSLAQTLRQHFQAYRLLADEGRAFQPHMTIAKLSKLFECSPSSPEGGRSGSKRCRQVPVRSIPEESYHLHSNIDAGEVIVNEVQLCAMGNRQHGQYYTVHSTVALHAAPAKAIAIVAAASSCVAGGPALQIGTAGGRVDDACLEDVVMAEVVAVSVASQRGDQQLDEEDLQEEVVWVAKRNRLRQK